MKRFNHWQCCWFGSAVTAPKTVRLCLYVERMVLGPGWKEGLAEWAEARKVSGLFPNDPLKLPSQVASPQNVPFDDSLPPEFSSAPTSCLRQGPAIGGNPSITGCCPKCGRSTWKCHLGCLPTLFIVLLFPIGLLLLLMPRRWECATCHYSYTSSDKPYGFTGSTTNV